MIRVFLLFHHFWVGFVFVEEGMLALEWFYRHLLSTYHTPLSFKESYLIELADSNQRESCVSFECVSLSSGQHTCHGILLSCMHIGYCRSQINQNFLNWFERLVWKFLNDGLFSRCQMDKKTCCDLCLFFVCMKFGCVWHLSATLGKFNG